MATRRRVLFDGALVLAGFCLAPSLGTARTSRHDAIYGCRLPDSEARQFLDTAGETRLFVRHDAATSLHSGDSDFDAALAMMLSDISDTLDVLPGFGFYDDYDGKNAYATRKEAADARLNRADGTVLFGQRLLAEVRASPDNPELRVACVCAHEFGHILQFKRGLYDRVNAGQPTVKRVELQADFFAGYFAGARKRRRPNFPAAVFADMQHNAGDEMVHNPQHHGTAEERAAAIIKGFELGLTTGSSLEDAIGVGMTYAMTF